MRYRINDDDFDMWLESLIKSQIGKEKTDPKIDYVIEEMKTFLESVYEDRDIVDKLFPHKEKK